MTLSYSYPRGDVRAQSELTITPSQLLRSADVSNVRPVSASALANRMDMLAMQGGRPQSFGLE